MNNVKILVVDDDEHILFAFRQLFEKEGYTSIEAKNGRDALDKIAREKPQLIFMDITMPDMDGMAALTQIKQQYRTIPVIIITGHGTMHTAIRAIKLGAFEYLTKPVAVAKIRQAIKRALLSVQSPAVDRILFKADILDQHELVGNSERMQEIYKLVGSVSTTPNQTPVLIVGESGTGKELVARAIHSNSAYPNEPFIAINCTAFPETLLESELLGHEKGSFTGAAERKLGKFEVAQKGTIFFDEIGDLTENLQLKLLRVLQEREFERLGGNNPIPIKARFLAATNQDIALKVKEGSFREDLYFRLNVVTIELPTLRDRCEDIPLLANYFLERYNYKLKKGIKGFSDEAMKLIESYSYPGNVRELENLIERAVMLTKGEVILPDVFRDRLYTASIKETPLPLISSVFSESRDYLLDRFEKQFIVEQLGRHNKNVSAAARASKMSRQNFHRLMVKHKIQADHLE